LQAIALILANPPEAKVYQAPVAAAADPVAALSNCDDKPAAVDIPQKKPSKTAVMALEVTALKNVLMAAGLAIPAKKADMAAAVMAGLEAETISLQLYYTSIEKPPPANNTVVAAATGPQPQCTLIVCPVSVMGNWQAQFEEHVECGTLKVGLYHGTDRKEMLDGVEKLDVLITSYNTLGYDYGKDSKAAAGPNCEPATKVFKGVTVFNTKFHR
jgi:SNF2-related domain